MRLVVLLLHRRSDGRIVNLFDDFGRRRISKVLTLLLITIFTFICKVRTDVSLTLFITALGMSRTLPLL